MKLKIVLSALFVIVVPGGSVLLPLGMLIVALVKKQLSKRAAHPNGGKS